MVLSAAQAVIFSNTAISIQEQNKLVQEVSLAERAIKNAATRQAFKVAYNALIIGNPPTEDIFNDASLTQTQIEFRDSFDNAGFSISRDEDSGFWSISWEDQGAEQLVTVYSIRTSVTPGAVMTNTMTIIENYFESLNPKARARVEFINPPMSGGDVDESAFGAPGSTYYEYIAVVDQPNDINHDADLKNALILSGLGYQETPTDNIEVYRIA